MIDGRSTEISPPHRFEEGTLFLHLKGRHEVEIEQKMRPLRTFHSFRVRSALKPVSHGRLNNNEINIEIGDMKICVDFLPKERFVGVKEGKPTLVSQR